MNKEEKVREQVLLDTPCVRCGKLMRKHKWSSFLRSFLCPVKKKYSVIGKKCS